MKIIFCCDPQSEQIPDPFYIDEVASATRAGFEFELINYQALVQKRNPARAVRDIPVEQEMRPALYRGWPLTSLQYAALYDALISRGLRLVTSPQAFRHTQHLPESLPVIQAHTMRTIWTDSSNRVSMPSIMSLLLPFAGRPIILRDFERAYKHYWQEACYIATSSESSAVENTVRNFLALRGADLVGGLVFREYVSFAPLRETVSGAAPMTQEFRLFFWHGKWLSTVHYWDVPGYEDLEVPVALFDDIARRVRSPFFTMDVGRRSDGEWMIIDLGDAQIAPLPSFSDFDNFFLALRYPY